MGTLLNFFINIGKLKHGTRRGWLVHGIKDGETTASHTFRVAMLGWALGKQKQLNTEKILKMALVHDICEVFAPDETPYDPLLPKNVATKENQKKAREILKKWPTFSLREKEKKIALKHQRELRSLEKLILDLPVNFRKEIKDLWLDFEKGLSREGRFMKQVDKAENFLQGIEYWKKYGKIKKNLWLRWAKEIFDDPVLLALISEIEKKFSAKK